MANEKKEHKDLRDVKAFKAVGQSVEKVGKIKFVSEFKDFISKGNVMDMEPIYIRKSEAEVLWDRRHPETAAKSEPSSIMIDAISGERGVRND